MEESDKDEDTFFNKYIKNGINANWTSRQRRDGNRSAISPSQGQSSERKEGKRRSKTLNSDKKCVTIFFSKFPKRNNEKRNRESNKGIKTAYTVINQKKLSPEKICPCIIVCVCLFETANRQDRKYTLVCGCVLKQYVAWACEHMELLMLDHQIERKKVA